MSKIAAAFAREPVMLGELVKSALTLGVAFGLNLTLDQLAALYGFVSLAGAFVVRAFVSPNKAPPSNGEPVAAVPQVKDEDAPPSTVRLAMLLGVLALGVSCSGSQKPQPSGCEALDYGALSATCGNDEAECNRVIEERERECAEKIQGGQ